MTAKVNKSLSPARAHATSPPLGDAYQRPTLARIQELIGRPAHYL